MTYSRDVTIATGRNYIGKTILSARKMPWEHGMMYDVPCNWLTTRFLEYQTMHVRVNLPHILVWK